MTQASLFVNAQVTRSRTHRPKSAVVHHTYIGENRKQQSAGAIHYSLHILLSTKESDVVENPLYSHTLTVGRLHLLWQYILK